MSSDSDHDTSESESNESNSESSESESNNYVIISSGTGEETKLELQTIFLNKILVEKKEHKKNIVKILLQHSLLYNEVMENRKTSNWNILCLEFSGILPYGDKLVQ